MFSWLKKLKKAPITCYDCSNKLKYIGLDSMGDENYQCAKCGAVHIVRDVSKYFYNDKDFCINKKEYKKLSEEAEVKFQKSVDDFLFQAELGNDCLIYTKKRAIGKTFTIKALGLELMSMGYTVLICSNNFHQTYYADDFVNAYCMEKLHGRPHGKTVVLIDDMTFDETRDIIEICSSLDYMVLGYIRIRDIFLGDVGFYGLIK